MKMTLFTLVLPMSLILFVLLTMGDRRVFTDLIGNINSDPVGANNRPRANKRARRNVSRIDTWCTKWFTEKGKTELNSVQRQDETSQQTSVIMLLM